MEKKGKELHLQQRKDELLSKIVDLAESYSTDPQKLTEFVKFSSRFYQYSPKNTMMIYAQNEHARFVQSFNDWNKEGCRILQGQKGLNIFVPVKVTVLELGNDQSVLLSQASKIQKQNYLDGKVKGKEFLRFKLGTTFDISQTNFPKEKCPELLGVGYESKSHDSFFKGLSKFAQEQLHCPVIEEEFPSITLRGLYSPDKNIIRINKLLEDTEKFSTLTHELGHAIVHNHKIMGTEKKSLNQIEFEGDAISIMLHEKFSLDVPEGRQRHLSHHYKLFVQEIEKKSEKQQKIIFEKTGKNVPQQEKGFIIGETFGRVFSTYQKHIEKIEDHLHEHLQDRKMQIKTVRNKNNLDKPKKHEKKRDIEVER